MTSHHGRIHRDLAADTHHDQLLLICLAVVVGTAAGYRALAFCLLTAVIGRRSRRWP